MYKRGTTLCTTCMKGKQHQDWYTVYTVYTFRLFRTSFKYLLKCRFTWHLITQVVYVLLCSPSNSWREASMVTTLAEITRLTWTCRHWLALSLSTHLYSSRVPVLYSRNTGISLSLMFVQILFQMWRSASADSVSPVNAIDMKALQPSDLHVDPSDLHLVTLKS